MLPPGSSPVGALAGRRLRLFPPLGSRHPTWPPLTCPRRERRRARPVAAADPAAAVTVAAAEADNGGVKDRHIDTDTRNPV